MYIIYLDESGDSNGWSHHQDNFVLGGIAVHEGQIRRLSEAIDDVQTRFFPEISVPIKFHAVDINGRGSGRFRSDLTDIQREQLMNDIYDVIAGVGYPNAVLFATAIDISSVESSDQSLRDTFEDIVQRVNTFLVRMNRAGNPQKGMLIIDGNQSTEQKFRSLISEFRNTGTQYGYLGNIAFISRTSANADKTRVLQIADFCAYALLTSYNERDNNQFTGHSNPPLSAFRSQRLPRRGRIETHPCPPTPALHILFRTGICRYGRAV